ncbi:uncharacterized protein LOC131887993 [Tigriopus californicus]|uniref:uncharacterized protein LOC131887993 n=1 Tax=Tigriopus californicus TaxID=6832 RepID=UPI0027D9EE6F|nr:uncharacterized protein LOC131887993 [Tigriopus californicus]
MSNPTQFVFQGSSVSKCLDGTLYLSIPSVLHHRYIRRSQTSHLHPETTHLLVHCNQSDGRGLTRRTKKILCALAASKVWLLPHQYILDSLAAGRLLPECQYDLGSNCTGALTELYVAPRDIRLGVEQSGGFFKDWKVVVVLPDLDKRRQYTDILTCGGAHVYPWTLQHLVDNSKECIGRLKMVVTDPSLLLNEKFQEFLMAVGETIPVVSCTFIEEFLTSASNPNPAIFDTLSEDVIQMHMEENAMAVEEPFYDIERLGSPNLGIRPDHVRMKLKLPSRSLASLFNEKCHSPDSDVVEVIQLNETNRVEEEIPSSLEAIDSPPDPHNHVRIQDRTTFKDKIKRLKALADQLRHGHPKELTAIESTSVPTNNFDRLILNSIIAAKANAMKAQLERPPPDQLLGLLVSQNEDHWDPSTIGSIVSEIRYRNEIVVSKRPRLEEPHETETKCISTNEASISEKLHQSESERDQQREAQSKKSSSAKLLSKSKINSLVKLAMTTKPTLNLKKDVNQWPPKTCVHEGPTEYVIHRQI